MGLSNHPDFEEWIKNNHCSCGAENARFDFVPDTIYGLSIKEACCRHDHRYTIGGNKEDKESADREFLSNMLYLIDHNEKWYYPTFLARRRAMDYFEAVVRAGNSSFNFTNGAQNGIS